MGKGVGSSDGILSRRSGLPQETMNAYDDPTVSLTPPMTAKITLTPREKEVQMLYARGKSPELIAIRLNMKVSKVLTMLAVVPKPAV